MCKCIKTGTRTKISSTVVVDESRIHRIHRNELGLGLEADMDLLDLFLSILNSSPDEAFDLVACCRRLVRAMVRVMRAMVRVDIR